MGWRNWLIEQRWLIAFFLLPLSTFYYFMWTLRCQYHLFTSSDPNRHLLKAQTVQNQVRKWRMEGRGRKMCTARPEWLSISTQTLHYKAKSYQVKVDLLDILSVDTSELIVRCEPMVTVRRLLDKLIPLGFTLPIVPEIGDLTVGGLVMGGGLESTSHKIGMWHEICERFELVLADASLIECSKTENSDLFHAIPWSYGSLGFLTAVDIRIVPFKPFVKLCYHSITTDINENAEINRDCFEILTQKIREYCGKSDSLEAILYDQNRAIVMTGDFTDNREGLEVNPIGKWHKEWFYEHAKSFLSSSVHYEVVPTLDFYFRHHRPYFWLTRALIPWGNNAFFRYLLGWTLPIHHGLLKLLCQKVMPEGANDNFVLQDYGLTLSKLTKGLRKLHEVLEIYPIWLCPVRNDDFGPVRMRRRADESVVVDVGVYGWCCKNEFARIRDHTVLEQFMLENEGAMGLYAETWLSESDFEQIFDCAHNKRMRANLTFAEEAFPSIYEKISKIGRS